MRQIEVGIFKELNQMELVENEFSFKSIQKGKKALNKHIYKEMRSKCEDFDIFGMMELQKQTIYKEALRRAVAAYDIEEQLISAAKGWDFAILNTSTLDSLFTDKDMKKECAEKVIYHIANGNFNVAEKTLISFINKARERTVEQCYNFISVSAEKVEVVLDHGLVAKDSSSGVIRVYDEDCQLWILPIDYYKKYKEIPEKLVELGLTKEILEDMLEQGKENE